MINKKKMKRKYLKISQVVGQVIGSLSIRLNSFLKMRTRISKKVNLMRFQKVNRPLNRVL